MVGHSTKCPARAEAHMNAVYCKFHGPTIGWQAVKVEPAGPQDKESLVSVVGNTIRILVACTVRGGWYINPKRLAMLRLDKGKNHEHGYGENS